MNGNLSPLLPAQLELPSLEEFVVKYSGDKFGAQTPEQLAGVYADLLRQVVFKNDEYQVNIIKGCEHGFGNVTLWHLSIKRLDKEPIHDWRDLQAIKNQLCGVDVEAIELYPAEDRLVDTANQYHLFAFMVDSEGYPVEIPVGWKERMIMTAADAEGTKAKQRDR